MLWDRKVDGGFPETKELKRRVRDAIDPGRDLGHVDRDYGGGGGGGGGAGGGVVVVRGAGRGRDRAQAATQTGTTTTVATGTGASGGACEDCR